MIECDYELIFATEIFTNGELPYKDLSDVQVVRGLMNKLRLHCDSSCPAPVYRLMTRCWEREPSKRIVAADLHRELHELAQDANNGTLVLDSTTTEIRL